MSYLHVQWLNSHEIETMNTRSKNALVKYLTKLDAGDTSVSEEPEFDSSYTEVEKILDYHEEDVMEVVDEPTPEVVEASAGADDEAIKVATAIAEAAPQPSGPGASSSSSASKSDLSAAAAAAAAAGGVPSQAAPNDEVVVLARSKVWRPVERCRKVIEKIWADPYASSFHYPVDTEEYDDYLDVVSQPMCLQDVLNKIDNGEYKSFTLQKFTHDVRLIWKNCKVYNLHKSQIWHCAHTLSLMFERLYQSWVLAFQDGTVSFDEPLGRPWENACRHCNKEDHEESVLLCDHCDAPYHIYCLRPKLASIPEDAWTCGYCTEWIKRTGAKPLSAASEEEARRVTEETSARQKVVRVRKKKYLVKWRGLSYRECTWETAEDLNDDEKIALFHKLNDKPPDEPVLTQAELGIALAKDRKTQLFPAMHHPNPMREVESTIYAQVRAFHFLKWNMMPTDALLRECGPATYAYTYGRRRTMMIPKNIRSTVDALLKLDSEMHSKWKTISSAENVMVKPPISEAGVENKGKSILPRADAYWFAPSGVDFIKDEVAIALSEMCYHVARGTRPEQWPTRPELLPHEIEVCVAKGVSGLFMNIGDYKNRVVVLGFRKMPNGAAGPAEATGKIKAGDVLVAINGVYVTKLGFHGIVKLLGTKDHPYLHLRFMRLDPNTPAKDISEALIKQGQSMRMSKRPSFRRSLYFGVFPSLRDEKMWNALAFDLEHKEVNLGEFEEEEEAARAYDTFALSIYGPKWLRLNFVPVPVSDNMDVDDNSPLRYKPSNELSPNAASLGRVVQSERGHNDSLENGSSLLLKRFMPHSDSEEEGKTRRKSKPVVWDSDDTSDSQDTASESSESSASDSDSDRSISSDSHAEHEADWDNKKKRKGDGEWRPKQDLDIDGPIGRLLRAVNESEYAPIRDDWTNFIVQMGMVAEVKDDGRPKKLQQIDLASGSVMRVWDTVNAASRALNIPVYLINAALKGRVDNGGGYKWKETVSDEVTAPEDDTEEKEKEKKSENWKEKLYEESKEYPNGGKLRHYQIDGLNWLLGCWYSKRSSILADEMGLGKTAQVITFLEHLFTVENVKGPFLCCVPLSTVEHWRREAESWSNMTCCVYHDVGGGKDMRDVIREYEWYYKGRSRRLLKFHVLITTYDDLIKDYEELAEIPWRAVIVDEAHRLRNINSKLIECMRSVVARGQTAYGYQHRILMTGTPLQNNTAELWTLLNFIEPAKFPDADKFAQRFGTINSAEQVEALQRRIAPHLLRRVKEDVAKDIPPKEETIIDVELTTMQKQYYRAIFEHNHGFLVQSTKGNMPKLMNIQMELRKCCNHPFMITGVEQKEMEDLELRILEEPEPVVVAPLGSSRSASQQLMLEREQLQINDAAFEKRR
jgi:hypothetical protein